MKLYLPINYLETDDFNDNGLNIKSDKPALILIQGDFCHFCTDCKPHFQQFADKYSNNINCFTAQIDGNRPSEQKLSSVIAHLDPSFKGAVPQYILLINGKNKSHTGKMTLVELEKFIS